MAVAQHVLSVSRLYTLAVLIFFLLAGCQNLNTSKTSLTAFAPLVYTGQQYQELAENSNSTEHHFQYQLLAARAYYQEQQTAFAYNSSRIYMHKPHNPRK